MRLNIVLLIFRKELRDVLRDRRTLIATFVLPLILYPGFILAFTQVRALEVGRLERERYLVGVVGRENAPGLFADDLLADEHLEIAAGVPATGKALLDRRLQLLVMVPEDFQARIEHDTTASLVVHYDQSDVRSREAVERFRRVVERFRRRVLRERLSRLVPPRDEAFLHPVRLTTENLAPQAQVLLSLAGGVLVFLAVIMALTGAFYPAVDACAGEKERGTIETLLVSPAARSEIVAGKYLLVLGMSLATAMLNLVVMALTIFAMVRFGGGKVEGLSVPLGIHQVAAALPSMVWVFVLLVPVAAFFSALSLAVAVFARSTKEAQYYMLPLYLLALPLAAVGAVTAVEMHFLLDLVPVAGAAVVFRSLLASREGTALHALVVFAANSLYAVLAVRWVAGLFRREEVLFREAEEFEWRFWRWRSFRSRDGLPTPAQVVLALGAGVVLAWYAGGLLAGVGGPVEMVILSQVVAVAGPPLLLAALFRLDWRKTFRARLPRSWLPVVLVVPLAVGAHAVLTELMYLLRGSLPTPRALEDLIDRMFAGPAGLCGVLVAVVLVPAVAEELMFRGFVLGGCRSRMRAAGAVVVSALLFGAYHLNPYQFVVGTLLGLLLGALALRTGSILAPMLFHLTNNALGVFIMLLNRPRLAGGSAGFFRRLAGVVLAADGTHYRGVVVLVAVVTGALAGWLAWTLSRTAPRRGGQAAEDAP